MTHSVALVLALAVGAWAQQTQTPNAGKRYALLVGNATYKKLPAVPAAVEESKALQLALDRAGFEITRQDNAGLMEFYGGTLANFLKQLKSGDVCFFYFSGYTVQSIDGDDNYLLPVDFDPNDDSPMQDRALRLRVIQQRIDRQTTALKIFMLESPRKLDLSIRGAVGAGVQAPTLNEIREALFAFAAVPGQVASAVPGGGIGLFTQKVIANIEKPGTRLKDVFENAKEEVARATQAQQIPLVENNVVTEGFYFHQPVEPPPVQPVPPPSERSPAPGFLTNNHRDHEDYVWIPEGHFQMGCVPADQHCEPNEKPQHEVRISKGFWMGRNEVQVVSYKRYIEAQKKSNPKAEMPSGPLEDRKWSKDSNPMVNITWDKAKAYCAWAGGRLPTEAEWEYAARAGSEAIYPFDGESSRDKANFEGKSGADIFPGVAPVHSFDPNAWKLHDMAGNVWEWVNDFYGEGYYRESPPVDPQGPKPGKDHVIRGGSFDAVAEKHLRISFRKSFGGSGNSLGFRCVLDETADTSKVLDR